TQIYTLSYPTLFRSASGEDSCSAKRRSARFRPYESNLDESNPVQPRRSRKGLGSKKPQRLTNSATPRAGNDSSTAAAANAQIIRSEEHTSELQSRSD